MFHGCEIILPYIMLIAYHMYLALYMSVYTYLDLAIAVIYDYILLVLCNAVMAAVSRELIVPAIGIQLKPACKVVRYVYITELL